MPETQQLRPNIWMTPPSSSLLPTITTTTTSNNNTANTTGTANSSSPTAAASSSSKLTAKSDLATSSDPHAPSSIPPWVHVDAANNLPPPQSHQLPSPARPNTRHYKPPLHYRVGRKWDHFRSAEPALLGAPIASRQLEWQPFMRSGPQPVEYNAEGVSRFIGGSVASRRVDRAWLEANIPAVMQGWKEEDEFDSEATEGEKALGGFKGVMYKGKWLISPERQERTVRFFWRLLLKNAFIPLVFRVMVLAFATAALGIGVTIYQNVRRVNYDNDAYNQCDPRPSTYMAIIVGAITIPYVLYVTWDEYTSKPLGLRSVAAKTLLLLCDLYFIVFSASNVSLAFDALLDPSWACYDRNYMIIGNTKVETPQTCPNNEGICRKQRALSGVLIVSLIAWLLCFSVSVLRVVEKLRPE